MLHGQVGEQSIAEEPFGKDPGWAGGEGAVTASTVTLLQFITNDFLAHRIHFNNGTGLGALGVHGAAAVGASVRPRHRCFTRDLPVGNVAPTMAAMTGLGTAPPLAAFWRRIGFEGDFGGRSRGTKASVLGCPF